MNCDCSMWVGKLRKPCRSYAALFLFFSLAGKCNWPWWFAIRASALLQGHWAASLAVKSAQCPARIYALRQSLLDWKKSRSEHLLDRTAVKNSSHAHGEICASIRTFFTYINQTHYMHARLHVYICGHACMHARKMYYIHKIKYTNIYMYICDVMLCYVM